MSSKTPLWPFLLVGTAFVVLNRKKVAQVAYKAAETVSDFATSKANKRILDELQPQARKRIEAFLSDIVRNTHFSPLLTSGYRSYEEQAAQHAANSKNAKPGTSKHNFGLAVDLNLVSPGKILRKASPRGEWLKTGVVALASKHGLEWGGNIKGYYDPVHFALDVPLATLLDLKKKQKVAGNKIVIPSNLIT